MNCREQYRNTGRNCESKHHLYSETCLVDNSPDLLQNCFQVDDRDAGVRTNKSQQDIILLFLDFQAGNKRRRITVQRAG